MAIKKVHSTPALLPSKQWFQRVSLLMLLTFALVLMIMSKTNNPAITKLRTQIDDVATPVLAMAASPMDSIHNAGAWIAQMMQLREENIMLKNENIELLKWQAAAKAMQEENQSLRSLLKVIPAKKSTYITARIVSDFGGPYVHSALINGGGEQGIKKDEATLSENGLMGRVIEVGDNSARILLLNDINSRVPVITEHGHEKGILLGNNSDMPSLSYLAGDSKIKVGETIITSGDGGVFPAGIPVGVVASSDKGIVRVQPYVDASKVEYVSVVDASF